MGPATSGAAEASPNKLLTFAVFIGAAYLEPEPYISRVLVKLEVLFMASASKKPCEIVCLFSTLDFFIFINLLTCKLGTSRSGLVFDCFLASSCSPLGLRCLLGLKWLCSNFVE